MSAAETLNYLLALRFEPLTLTHLGSVYWQLALYDFLALGIAVCICRIE
jgi:hypothetical protein